MLIQIVDYELEFPVPLREFKEVHKFEFMDMEDSDNKPDEIKLSQTQASEIVGLLKRALENSMNVIVHCVAGVCRSGAVADVGVMIGFDDTETYRSPNLRVKHMMMRELGLTYDAEEPVHDNYGPFQYDDLNNKVRL